MIINNVNQNNFRPQFGAKILLTKLSTFNQLPLQSLKNNQKYVGYPWDVYNSIKSMNEGYTDGAVICTSGFIQNGKEGFLFHLNPNHKNNTQEAVAKKLLESIAQLRKSKDEVSGFLTGGCSFFGPSQDFYMLIKDILKNEKIPFSALWGAKTAPYTDLFASAKTQEIIVNHNWANKIIKQKEDIQNMYEDVFLHEGDEFIF